MSIHVLPVRQRIETYEKEHKHEIKRNVQKGRKTAVKKILP